VNQDPNTRIYAAMGVAGQMGCLMLILVLGSLLVGTAIDQVLHTRRVAILVCVLGSLPLNLGAALIITQRQVKRMFPPTPGKSTVPSGDSTPDEVDDSAS
jgi:hypothetical protein